MAETELSANANLVVKNLVRAALSHERAKKPLKKEDIRELILKSSASESQKEIFNAAQKELKAVFGCELTELPAKRRLAQSKKNSKKGTASTGKYVLISTIPSEVIHNCPPAYSEDEEKTNGVIAVVLSILFISGGTLSLDSLLNRIEQVGLPKLDIFKNYPENEEVRNLGLELISHMIKLEYLVRSEPASITNTSSRSKTSTRSGFDSSGLNSSSHSNLNLGLGRDGAIDTNMEYLWGPRAFLEYSNTSIAKFIATISDSLYDSAFISNISKSSEIEVSEFLRVDGDDNISSDHNNSYINSTQQED
ncbi:hypothetical protein BB561_000904 [Smittium simulii]|uniref:MAGE domain-containing protein n=1 Tax=Smittium simulii TaxID=133385 RepID=A0A2T9YX39_9FUNG|nr:hypothetical protein BB561_000904 [Smittium simulii]